MKIKLFLEHIKNSFHENISPVLADDGSNKDAFYCADVVGSRKFVLNHGGYPRSEIAELNEMTNVQQMQSLLSQMADYSPSSNLNAGLTDAEIMLGHKSKYLQTPSESVCWLEEQLRIRASQREAAVSQSEPGDKISFEQNQNDAIENA